MIFQFTEENNLFDVNQSVFLPGDSCEYHLLSIVHNIYAGFDQNLPLEVCSCFFDISKTFNKVWHEEFIYNIERLLLVESSVIAIFCVILLCGNYQLF